MVKVHDWMASGKAPNNPSVEDMRYGLGCMRDLMMDLAGLMSDLLETTGQSQNYDATEIVKKLEAATFGKQITILERNYPGDMIHWSKMDHACDERNYFTHDYVNDDPSQSDGERLINLLNLLQKLIGQMQNALDNTNRQVRVKNNVESNDLRTILVKAIHNLEPDNDGDVFIAEVGNELIRMGYAVPEGLMGIIESFDWQVVCRTDYPNEKYVRVNTVR